MYKFPSINLVKKRGNFVDKFIDWTLTVGRGVIILTEAVALSAFIYRFSLDDNLVNLHDQISQEQSVVSAFKDQENLYRDLQDRLAFIKTRSQQTIAKTTQLTKVFNDIKAFIPDNILVDNLSLSDQSLKISASTQSLTALGALIQQLRNYPAIASISLDNIQNKTSTATIAVNISATLKQ